MDRLLILSFVILLSACNSQEDKSSSFSADSIDTLTKTNLERFIPENKGIEKLDTIIASKNLQIIITKTDLDSYVVNEYEEEGHKQIDKYRDAEIALTIKQNSQTLLDTIFRKEQFLKHAEKGFLDIAIFHNYWFKRLEKDRIELFGVISKPETDWTIDFHHYFNLTTRKMTFQQEIDDEE